MPRICDEAVYGLVERIYEASVEPDSWTPFLELLARTLRSQTASFFVQNLDGRIGSVGAAIGLDPEHQRLYDSRFARQNILMERAAPLLASGYVGTEAVAPADELLASDYYNEFLRPMGTRHTVGVCLFRERSLASMLTLLRRDAEGPYRDDELGLCRRLVPHLQRAIAVQRRLEGARLTRDAALATLDRLHSGIVFVDRGHRILFANRAAKCLLDARDGLATAHGRIEATWPGDRAPLDAAIGRAARGAEGLPPRTAALRIERRGGGRPLALLVSPIAPIAATARWGDGSIPEVALLISDPEPKADTPVEILAGLYGLTPAEARVTLELATEKNLAECADALGIAVGTVRTHVKSVLAKTGVRRQSELMRLLHLGPLQLRGD